MDIVAQIWEATSITMEGLWALLGIAAFGLLTLALTLRVRQGRPYTIRSLEAANRLRLRMAHAMETGEEMHVALGSGGLSGSSTADTLAGLYLVSHVAHRAALAEVPVRVRVADPTALAGAMATLQHSALATGYPEAQSSMQAEFVATAPSAYAAGVADAVGHELIAANAMIGAFGPEVLLPAEAGARRGLAQFGGASAPATLPLLAATVEAPLLGEELYAIGAALGVEDHTGSLAAQDAFRALLAAGIVLLTILGLVGY